MKIHNLQSCGNVCPHPNMAHTLCYLEFTEIVAILIRTANDGSQMWNIMNYEKIITCLPAAYNVRYFMKGRDDNPQPPFVRDNQ